MYYLNYFFLYSIIGYLFETVFLFLIHNGGNSGYLYGPWTPVYGIGIILIIFISNFVFKNIKKNKIIQSIIILLWVSLALTIIEWIGGITIEYLFHVTFWNYSKFKLAMGKYVAIEISLVWGVLALAFIYLFKDISDKLVNKIPKWLTYTDMNPVSWTWKRGFYMSKLSYEDKINIYNNKKEGMSIKALSKKYDVRDNVIKYLVRVIDKHGYEVLRTNKNNYYSPNQKEQIINRVLIDGESIFSVAVDEGLSSDGLLRNWISKYKENGYNIVERKRGRSTMPKVTKKKENETDKEKIKRLEEENLYLKAELEYSKKLRAVVQARKNQQQKKK